MKRLLLVVLLGVSILSLTGCENKEVSNEVSDNASKDSSKEVSYEGYLIDKHCAEMKKGEEETLKCIKMDKCESSGYGIAVDIGNEEEKFIKFDKEGHEKAKEFINTIPEDKEKIGKISVKGHYEGQEFILEEINS
ncbi:MAG: hypothetical protein ACI398_09710 [Clostridium sp.]